MSKTAIITGIYGQDAFFLRKKLISENYKVIGLTRKIRKSEILDENITLYQTSYTEKEIQKIFSKFDVDVVYHLCGQSKVALSWIHIEETINSQALIALSFLNTIQQFSSKTRFINASSSEIFRPKNNELINEDYEFYPINPYGVAQLFSFNLCTIFREKYNLFISNAILFPHESNKRNELFVVRKMISTLKKISDGDKNKLILGNIDVVRDWGYAEEYTDAMYLMSQSDYPSDYCICSSVGMSVREILLYVLEYFNLDLNLCVEFDSNLTRYLDFEYVVGDNSKIRNDLNWKPKLYGSKLIEQLIKDELELD